MGFFQLRGTALIAMILVTSGLDFLLFGYDQGLFGGILAGERFQKTLGHPSPTMTGLVTAIYDIGCAFGAVSAFFYGEVSSIDEWYRSSTNWSSKSAARSLSSMPTSSSLLAQQSRLVRLNTGKCSLRESLLVLALD